MASLNETPKGERLHIAFFGKRNAGKSSLVNAFTMQDLSIVSDVKGTTTDPVYKAMELLPIGPVMIIDTPGIDDEGELGLLRVNKAMQILNKTDLAVIVSDTDLEKEEKQLIEECKKREIPYIVARTKKDLLETEPASKENEIYTSAKNNQGIVELRELCAKVAKGEENQRKIVSDLLSPSDVVLLVVPIDKAAPKGRLILPQQQTIRDILDGGTCAMVCRDTELLQTIEKLKDKPKLVITDSQVFGFVSKILKKDIPLTSFSILMARYKGTLQQAVEGVAAIESLEKGDKILIAEGCTHHKSCEDIGTVKIPLWIKNKVGFDVDFAFTSGNEFPTDLKEYKLVVHCGGCMLTEREMKYRLRTCQSAGVPMTNYGTLIAYLNGILKRTLEPFPQIAKLLEK